MSLKFVPEVFRLLSTMIDSTVYSLITHLYNVFITIATVNLFDNDFFNSLADRLMAFLGIFMIFRMAIAFVQYIFDPIKLSDAKTGTQNLVKKFFIVLFLLVLTPYIFDYANHFQNVIMEESIIEKIILPSSNLNANDTRVNVSTKLYSSFVYINPDVIINGETGPGVMCSDFAETDAYSSNVAIDTTESLIISCSNMAEQENIIHLIDVITATYKDDEGKTQFVFEYMYLIPFCIGVYVAYVFICYIYAIGTRVFKLLILQIISPIAIISYLNPTSDGVLIKWANECKKVYLSLFINTGIVFLVLAIINFILGDFATMLTAGSESLDLWIRIILVLIILSFGKTAPSYIGQFFNIEVSSDQKAFNGLVKNVGKSILGGTVGATVAATGNLARNHENFKNTWNDGNRASAVGGAMLEDLKGKFSGYGYGAKSAYNSNGFFNSVSAGVSGGIRASQNNARNDRLFKNNIDEKFTDYENDLYDIENNKYKESEYWLADSKNKDDLYNKENDESFEQAYRKWEVGNIMDNLPLYSKISNPNNLMTDENNFSDSGRELFRNSGVYKNLDRQDYESKYVPLDKEEFMNSSANLDIEKFRNNKKKELMEYKQSISGLKSRVGFDVSKTGEKIESKFVNTFAINSQHNDIKLNQSIYQKQLELNGLEYKYNATNDTVERQQIMSDIERTKASIRKVEGRLNKKK